MEQSTHTLHTEHLIIGTAGHIDHGKTSLVKALTGIDADRLPEEKQRGLTIDIGFAYLDLNSDYRISIVDVPGHERFVKNMLAGATSINLVLFVIAADGGVMPQTVEHLEIINLLGIQHGIVVVTKKDLVTDEWLEVVQDDIKRILAGTTLEHAPILPVSTITGEGIESCKAMIKKLITQVKVRGSDRVFRLPIDRSFTISGYGCVVTGPILGGQISVDNEVEILPLKKTLRVRGIEVTGEQVHTAFAGQRAAINLTGIKSGEVKRGYELSIPGYLEPTNLIDATLKLIKSIKNPLKNRTRIRFHSNTSEVMGRVILLDRDSLKPGEESCIQIFLENLITTERNDRFIIRSYSPAYTIGGGVVLRSNTTRLKRFKGETLKILKTLASGNLADIIEQIYLNNSHAVLTSDDISRQANIHPSIAADITAELVKKGSLLKFDIDGKGVVFHRNIIAALREEILHILRTFHKENPLKAGIEETYLKTLLRKDTHPLSIAASLSTLKREKTIKVIDGKLSLKDFEIELSAQDKSKANKIEEFFLHAGFTPPSIEEVYTKFGTSSKSTISLLVEQKKIIALENDLYFHTTTLDTLKGIIKEYIRKHGSINVAQFRDLTKTSRKFAVPLMEYFDAIRFTRRTGDVRILL
ncbi:MAG: selenocysteine-specific translation elongation factor [Candidatus Jettenia sp.]|uniref:Selenocysteine-specific translation elongation factor n=1 Tax=Candidatus Jettenia caeni TaxID=247490 RepID=I3IQR0_9BACT|nr:selenocysteine-specific translation elongation factor [Candidatus Jettenia sp. AMX1]MBC6929964.1 selenocysteine-specific translation elongation factor [Candidatus Jettenia sp.]GAB64055.1 selenocysteine-specific translation elongation factor [Candidatus Jettenia caeni]KAA0248451.1 MAG: selenocysteine-specific translation elongation factor [Candidatus Jettenia sp. AMX1]MCE7881703.1 selenocysteine-specific translation elongation factor [Candidatus Jettenia sp. AMX1]MCQ3928244.1 selenocysteine-